MIFAKVIYVVVLLVLYFIMIMFSPYEAYLSFVLAVAIPVTFFIILIINRFLIKLNIDIVNKYLVKGDNAKLRLNFKNRFILPTGNIYVYVDTFYGENKAESSKYILNLLPFSNKYFDIDIPAQHSGRMKIKINKIVLLDFTKIFSLRLKRNVKEVQTIVFPSTFKVMVDAKKIVNNELIESDIYDANVKGNDKSEIFGVREYTEGDLVRDIHWKLSSKSENLFVKEYSKPICNDIDLICDLSIDCRKEEDNVLLDKVLEILFSVGYSMCFEKIPFTVCTFNKNVENCVCERIEDSDELAATMSCILNAEEKSEVTEESKISFINVISETKHSNKIIITSDANDLLCEYLRDYSVDKNVILIIVMEADVNDYREFYNKVQETVKVILVDKNMKEMGGIDEISFK